MKITRAQTLNMVLLEGVGSFPLGTLQVSQLQDKLSLFDTVRDRYLFFELPYTLLQNDLGANFASANEAKTYLDNAVSAPQVVVDGGYF